MSGKTRHRNKMASGSGERMFTFYIHIPLVNVTHTLKQLSKRATISELKELIEITCGIPTTLQRVFFLDRSDLEDYRVLTSLDIVNKATFTLEVWNKWENIISSVYKNDFKALQQYALCSDKTSKANPVATREKRGEVALFAAVKLGNVDLIKKLIQHGVNANARTELGYSPLHVALANGKYNCIDFLLEYGVDNDTKSSLRGQLALKLSKENGFPDSERHLCMFEWQLRSKTAASKPSRLIPLLPHQQYDSKTPTWFNGSYAAKFVCSSLPSIEFSGTRIDAPKINPVKLPYSDDKDYYDETDTGAERIHRYISHDTWLRRKQEEQTLLRQKQEQLAATRLHEREREESEKKRLLSLRKRENEKRALAIKDNTNDKYRKRQGIYEEFTYVPCYEKAVLQQYLNELITN